MPGYSEWYTPHICTSVFKCVLRGAANSCSQCYCCCSAALNIGLNRQLCLILASNGLCSRYHGSHLIVGLVLKTVRTDRSSMQVNTAARLAAV
jgi:hypothetical protein